MKNTTLYPSIKAIGERLGPLITGHFDRAFRAIMSGPEVHFEPNCIRYITGEPHPLANFAIFTDVPTPDAVAAAIEPLTRCAAPSAVIFTESITPAVGQRLKNAGFEAHDPMPAMAVNIADLAPTPLPEGCAFSRVRAAVERDRWADVFGRGYGLPACVGDAFSRAMDRDPSDDADVQYFWITRNGAPVCTSVLYLADGVAGIYAVATLPEHRGQGLGAFVTAEPLRFAARLGYRVGVLQASAEGEPVYRRLGFDRFGDLLLFLRMPAQA